MRDVLILQICMIISLLFNHAAYSSEFDPLSGCVDLSIDNIPQLSLKKKQTKQYASLLKLLESEKVVEKNNKKILSNFYKCWLLAATSIKLESIEVGLTNKGLMINSKLIKFGNTSQLSRNINKTIRALDIEQKGFKDLIWYCFTESAIATTNNRYNYYIYADLKPVYDVHFNGRRQQLGFTPDFINGDIVVDKITDPELSSSGLKVGMLVQSIKSDTQKIDKKRDWWFQGRAFDYTLLATDGKKQITVEGRSKVQIKESITSLVEDGIAYIQIHYFNKRTGIEVWRFLRNLEGTAKGVILDVRGNSGGTLSLDLVSFFLKSNQLVAVIDQNDGIKHEIKADMAYVDQAVVVLQDENSASMSELLAGMLQKQGRAVVVGQTSFGKAAVQHILPVLNEGQLALVKENLYYPDFETSWADVGIEPDIKVEVDEQQELQLISSVSPDAFQARLNTDLALRRAITLLKTETTYEH